jgi:hypothetical protein
VDERRFGRIWANRLRTELKADQVRVTGVSGILNPDQPLVVNYTVSWNTYAEVTKAHVIFVQSVFGSHLNPILTTETRHNDLLFPFHYKQVDDVRIHLPEGCTLESPSAPGSAPGGQISMLFNVTYSKKENLIHFQRDFTSNLSYVRQERYPDLKHWFDAVSQSENHELVLVKPAAPPPAAPVATPSTPAPNPDQSDMDPTIEPEKSS